MIVGWGYDQCYENPRFEFGKVLSTVTNASGATVQVISLMHLVTM